MKKAIERISVKLSGISVVKIVGVAAMCVSMAATMMENWVKDKELDERIAAKVEEALAERELEEENEEEA